MCIVVLLIINTTIFSRLNYYIDINEKLYSLWLEAKYITQDWSHPRQILSHIIIYQIEGELQFTCA